LIKPILVAMMSLSLVLSLPILQAAAAAAYVPHPGDSFSYYEVENLNSGTGSYAGYSELMLVNGTEQVIGVSAGVVSAHYAYAYTWSNSSGSTKTGSQAGSYTFSSTSLLYLNGTDDQTGYVNPTVWFAMGSSVPTGGKFTLLDTQMTVMSRNYSFYLPSQNRNVNTIFAQGSSEYLRNDQYGMFTATYTWNAFFDPSTGYIVGYSYVEHDTNSSGNGFMYTDNLYVTSTSYPLAAGAAVSSVVSALSHSTTTAGSQVASAGMGSTEDGYILAIALIVVVVVLFVALSRRGRRRTLPEHTPLPQQEIHLNPEQPQQVVIKEVAKVNCKFCGTLIDSTLDVCPHCGAPRT
jgi:hypothetical protein